MLKVFEWTILLSSAINMVTQIIYLGRMEVGDWYYAVVFKKKFGFRHFNMNLLNENLCQC